MMMEEEEETLFDQENLLNDQKSASEEKLLKQRRLKKTLAISMAFFCLGLCIAIPGPTLIELGRNVKSNTEHMSYIFTARSIGYLIGSVVGGILFDFFDQQLLLFYTLAFTAVATIGVPWCSALLALSLLICVQGIAVGVLDTGGNVFCIKIWGRKSAPYMQLLHFSFGVGAFLAPLIVEPFFLGNSGFNESIKVGPYGSLGKSYHLQQDIYPENSSLLRHSRESASFSFGSSNSIIRNGYFESIRSRRQATIESNNITQSPTGETLNTSLSTALNDSTTITITTTPPRPRKPSAIDSNSLSKVHADSEIIQNDLTKMIEKNSKNSPPLAPQPVQTTTTISLVSKLVSIGTLDNSSDAQNQSMYENTSAQSPVVTTVLSPTTSTSTESTTTTTTTTITTAETSSSSTTTEMTTTLPTTTTTATSTSLPTEISTSKSLTSQPINHPSDGSNMPVSNSHIYKPSATFDKISSNGTNVTKPEALDRSLIGNVIEELKAMSKIQVAYLIIGLFLALNAAFFLFLHYQDLHSRIPIHSLSQVDLTRQPDSRLYRVSLLGLLFLFFYVYVGLEVTFGGLITTFAENYKPTISMGATLAALFWGCLASGRGISVIIARYFKPPCMIVGNLVLIITGSCILSFTTLSSPGMIWFGTIVFGLGMSSIYPTAISWADTYYPLTGKATAVFVAGSGVGEMTLPLLTAYLYQNVEHMSLMYMCLTLSLLLVVLYANLQVVACRRTKTSGSRSHTGFMRLQNSEEMADAMDLNSVSVTDNGLTETLRRRDVNSTDDDKRKQNGGSHDVSEFTKLMELSD